MREKNRFLALRDLVDKLEVQKGGGAKTAAEKAADKKKKQKDRRKRKSSKKQAAGDVVGLVGPPYVPSLLAMTTRARQTTSTETAPCKRTLGWGETSWTPSP